MKILNLQDLHINPKWITEAEADNARICEVAKTEKVDAICIAGDFFDKSVMANDSSEYQRILKIGENLQKIAQVFYIKGTPSHDSPGCYAPFDLIGWKEVNIGKSHTIGNTLIIGIPEINQAFIHEKYPELSKQEAIEQQYILTGQIIDDYYVPLSVSHKGPVHFMLHGHVDGVKFRDDQKPRTSEFMWNESMLERIKADFYQAGHIHLPQSFKTINGRYGGTSHLTWNDINFVPGFDVITYDMESDYEVIPQRFSFDKPMRQKINITNIEDIKTIFVEPDINLWVDIKCDKEFADQFDKIKTLEDLKLTFNLAPLSKITTSVQHIEHTRVDVEEYEKAVTLEDLYKLYDSEVSKAILKKVKTAEDATEAETASIEKRTFQFLDLRLRGSVVNFENDVEEIYVDYDSYKTGANLLVAPNGKGKSVINGMCTPFGCHLPKQDNLKDFFVLKDSSVIRRLQIVETGEIITQKVLIDPTLANPSAKFYMDIDGKNIAAENGNKDIFDDKVSEIFGSIKMFMACTFRGQKENDKIPSLEKAKEADLRQIFTELSGIDRTPLKNFSHEEVKKLKSSIALDEREIETLEADKESKEDIEKEISDNKSLKYKAEQDNKNITIGLTKLKSKLSKVDKIIIENENLETQIKDLETERDNTSDNKDELQTEQLNIAETLKNASSTRSELEKLKKVQTDHTTAATAYFEAQGVYNKTVTEWQDDKDKKDERIKKIESIGEEKKENVSKTKTNISNDDHEIKILEASNMMLNKPCEHCKKLPSSSNEKISENNKKIEEFQGCIDSDKDYLEEMDGDIIHLRERWHVVKDSIPEKPIIPETLTALKKSMDDIKPDPVKIKELETIITGLQSSESRQTELITLITQTGNRINEITEQVTTLQAKIKTVDKPAHEALKNKITSTETAITSNIGEIARLTAEIEALKTRLQKNIDRVIKIKTITEKVVSCTADRSEWEVIEAAFSPKGIPAMELSMIAPLINRAANDLLTTHGNRYRVEIITQDLDSKNNIAEKFKILVHDNKSNEPKNLPVMSGGQAVWLTKALQEAISKIASQRSGRTWLYSIMDEADAALDTEDVVSFYDMIDRAMDGKRKLVSVTHSTEAKLYVNNVIDIEEFFVRGE